MAQQFETNKMEKIAHSDMLCKDPAKGECEAHYTCESHFICPWDLDKVDEDKDCDWWVKWDILYVDIHDRTYQYHPKYSGPQNIDCKRPSHMETTDYPMEDVECFDCGHVTVTTEYSEYDANPYCEDCYKEHLKDVEYGSHEKRVAAEKIKNWAKECLLSPHTKIGRKLIMKQAAQFFDTEDEMEEEEDTEKKCTDCENSVVDIEDRLCHSCYHKSCDKGECYCGEDMEEEEDQVWCEVGEHKVSKDDMWEDFADCQNCVSLKEYNERSGKQYEKICDDPDCSKVLGIDVPIMCYMNKKEGDKTLCQMCYDGGYAEDDENPDNETFTCSCCGQKVHNEDGVDCQICCEAVCDECMISDEDDPRCKNDRCVNCDEEMKEDEDEELPPNPYHVYMARHKSMCMGCLKKRPLQEVREDIWFCEDCSSPAGPTLPESGEELMEDMCEMLVAMGVSLPKKEEGESWADCHRRRSKDE